MKNIYKPTLSENKKWLKADFKILLLGDFNCSFRVNEKIFKGKWHSKQRLFYADNGDNFYLSDVDQYLVLEPIERIDTDAEGASEMAWKKYPGGGVYDSINQVKRQAFIEGFNANNYEFDLKTDGCKSCVNNKPGKESGLYCINNCISGSRFEQDPSKPTISIPSLSELKDSDEHLEMAFAKALNIIENFRTDCYNKSTDYDSAQAHAFSTSFWVVDSLKKEIQSIAHPTINDAVDVVRKHFGLFSENNDGLNTAEIKLELEIIRDLEKLKTKHK